MALARPELTASELAWIVGLIDDTKVPHDMRRAARTMRRELDSIRERERRERRHLKKRRAARPNAPGGMFG